MSCKNCTCPACSRDNEDIKKETVEEVKCAICKRDLIPLYDVGIYIPHIYDAWIEGGAGFILVPRYGSSHDSREFYVAICDDCLGKLHTVKIEEPF